MNKDELLSYIAFIAVYVLCILSPLFLVPTGIFAPYAFLNFTKSSKFHVLPYVFLVLLFGGSAFLSVYSILFFTLTFVIPALILKIVHNKGYGYSWRSLVFAPLPFFLIYTTVLLMFPELRAEYHVGFVNIIEQIFNSSNLPETVRLDGRNPMVILYASREQYVTYLINLSPALLFGFIALVTYFTERNFYKLSHGAIVALPDLMLGFLVISGLCVVMPVAIPIVHLLGINGLIIVGAIYFCRGLDIVGYYLIKWKMRTFIRVLMYTLILMEQVLMAGVAVLGIASVYKNLIRKEDDSDKKI